MSDLEPPGWVVGVLGTIGGVVAGGLAWLETRRSRASKEAVTVAEDKHRIDTTDYVRDERDKAVARADAAEARADALAIENAQLKSDNRLLKQELRDVEHNVKHLMEFAPPVVREFLQTNFKPSGHGDL